MIQGLNWVGRLSSILGFDPRRTRFELAEPHDAEPHDKEPTLDGVIGELECFAVGQ